MPDSIHHSDHPLVKAFFAANDSNPANFIPSPPEFPTPTITSPERQYTHTQMKRDVHTLVDVLYEIMLDTEDAEIVKLALSGLSGTDIGLRYLADHPVKR